MSLLLVRCCCCYWSWIVPVFRIIHLPLPALSESSLSLILLFYCTTHKIFTSINFINISTEFLISIFRLFMGKMALLRRGNPAINNNSVVVVGRLDSDMRNWIQFNSETLGEPTQEYKFRIYVIFGISRCIQSSASRLTSLRFDMIFNYWQFKREQGKGSAVDRHLTKFILKLTPHFVYNNSLMELFIILRGRFIAFSTHQSEIIFLEGEFEWKFEIIFHKL